MLSLCRAGQLHLVLTWKLDRAFRSSLHALSTIEEWERLGVGFSCLTQAGIDTTTATGKLTLQILAAVAEFERSLIRERVREGLVNARRKGRRLGRPSVAMRPGFGHEWKAVKAELDAGRLTRAAAARRLGIAESTLRRLLELAPKTRGRKPRPKP